MSDTQKPVDIQSVRQTLLDEGCPDGVVDELVRHFKSHPGANAGDLIRHLDVLAGEIGNHPTYRGFKASGFRQHQTDPLLVSWV